MIKDESASTMSYQILDPWVRVNACLEHTEAAHAAVKRLEKIGYRDNSYVQFISALH